MFQIGQQVMYGIHGVCTILGVEEKKINRKNLSFYVLEPVEQIGARFYVPVHNVAAVSKLQPIITQEELISLLHSDQAGVDTWIEDENRRKMRYREIIVSGDRIAMINMVNSLFKHKEQQINAGKKFHLCDENFLKDALKLLNAEFSLALDMNQIEVGEYIKNILNKS